MYIHNSPGTANMIVNHPIPNACLGIKVEFQFSMQNFTVVFTKICSWTCCATWSSGANNTKENVQSDANTYGVVFLLKQREQNGLVIAKYLSSAIAVIVKTLEATDIPEKEMKMVGILKVSTKLTFCTSSDDFYTSACFFMRNK